LRGIKGWGWTPEQYLEEIPVLTSYKLNFLMNCYLSMFSSLEPGAWKNEWWKPLPESKKAAYAQVIRAARASGLNFCFAVHPQLASSRPLDPTKEEDIDQVYQHYALAQQQGVSWFSISLDDVRWDGKGARTGGSEHSKLVNRVLERLRKTDSRAQMIFCPGPYWGDASGAADRAYLEALAQELNPDVYVFWTGQNVYGPSITRASAARFKNVVKHRLFLWDNYPVNDANPTMHLGPVIGRDRDLGEVIDGYLSNPMAQQNRINRIPLATCADYAFNPWSYDPARSIEQAIRLSAQTIPQQQLLKTLVEMYPGFLSTGGGSGKNPVRDTFESLTKNPAQPRAAKDFFQRVEDFSTSLSKEFSEQYPDACRTVAADVGWMKQRL